MAETSRLKKYVHLSIDFMWRWRIKMIERLIVDLFTFQLYQLDGFLVIPITHIFYTTHHWYCGDMDTAIRRQQLSMVPNWRGGTQ